MATILELGTGLSAGYAGKLFRRWGAEVWRVDVPQSRDFPARDEHRAVDLYLHAGKKRLALDPSKRAGIDIVRKLSERADIVLGDDRPDRLAQWGFDDLGLPGRTVRVAITPFGVDGPKRDWRATSNVLLAMGGQTYLMGDAGRAPLTMPGRYLFYQAGQYAYTAALASHRVGQAPLIDVSVLETALSVSQFTTVMWTYSGRIRERHGNDFGALHPITMYPCRDGWFAVNVTPDFWPPFCAMLGLPELADDPRFAGVPDRVENAKVLDAIVAERIGHLTRAEILDLGQRQFRVPTGTLLSPAELLADPHLRERGFFQTLVDGEEQWQVPGSAFRYVGENPPEQPAVVAPLSPTDIQP